jgi:hypothetical protein
MPCYARWHGNTWHAMHMRIVRAVRNGAVHSTTIASCSVKSHSRSRLRFDRLVKHFHAVYVDVNPTMYHTSKKSCADVWLFIISADFPKGCVSQPTQHFSWRSEKWFGEKTNMWFRGQHPRPGKIGFVKPMPTTGWVLDRKPARALVFRLLWSGSSMMIGVEY